MTTNLAAFLFCDDFVTDSSNKSANSIFNVVESLQSDQLPCISSGAFYYALRGLEGEHTFKVTRQQPNLEFVTILEKPITLLIQHLFQILLIEKYLFFRKKESTYFMRG